MIKLTIEKIDGSFVIRKSYHFNNTAKYKEPELFLTLEALKNNLAKLLEVRQEPIPTPAKAVCIN